MFRWTYNLSFFSKKIIIQAVWNCFEQFGHECFFLCTSVSHMNNNNNKTWILFAMSAYSFDEPKFTSARKKEEKKEKTISKTPKLNACFFVCICTTSVGISESVLFFGFMLILRSILCLLVLYEYSKQNNICENIIFILYLVFYMVTSYNCCCVGWWKPKLGIPQMRCPACCCSPSYRT